MLYVLIDKERLRIATSGLKIPCSPFHSQIELTGRASGARRLALLHAPTDRIVGPQ